MGNPHRNENYKDSEAKLGINVILDKGEKRSEILDFKSQNG